MLPLEVMGPGGSLSMFLFATSYWREANRRMSWKAVTSSAAYSCDQTAAALIFGLGDSKWQQRRIGFCFQWRRILNYMILA
jgi:hypothetical protein